MLCHLPFVLPLVGLGLFAFLPLPAALGVYLPLALLSLAVAVPSVRAMSQPPMTGAEGMRGKQGVVVDADGRSGMVLCEGELWRCRAPGPLAPGDRVSVIGIEGLTARVRPAQRPGPPRIEGVGR
jgi:membrane protein implicated in regulation of membrane protease activity